MHAVDVLGDPVRRRALGMLGGGERAAGEIVEVMREEFAITQAAEQTHTPHAVMAPALAHTAKNKAAAATSYASQAPTETLATPPTGGEQPSR